MKKQQDEDRRMNESRTERIKAEIKSLIKQNSNMAEELRVLKANVEQTTNDNATIRCVLDIKQGEWTKIEQTGHKKRNVSINEDIYINEDINEDIFKHSLMKILQTMLVI